MASAAASILQLLRLVLYLEEEDVTTDSVNTRELILEILLEVTERGQYSHLVIRSVLEKYQYLDKRGACLFNESGGGHHSAPDRTGLYSGSVLKSKGQKNEAG